MDEEDESLSDWSLNAVPISPEASEVGDDGGGQNLEEPDSHSKCHDHSVQSLEDSNDRGSIIKKSNDHGSKGGPNIPDANYEVPILRATSSLEENVDIHEEVVVGPYAVGKDIGDNVQFELQQEGRMGNNQGEEDIHNLNICGIDGQGVGRPDSNTLLLDSGCGEPVHEPQQQDCVEENTEETVECSGIPIGDKKKDRKKKKISRIVVPHDPMVESTRSPRASNLPFTLLRRPSNASGSSIAQRPLGAISGNTLSGSVGEERRRILHSLFSTSNSCSGAGGANGHKHVWLRGVEDEAMKIWVLGKEFGATAAGNEGDIVSKLVDMECRDAQEAGDLAGMEPRRDVDGDQ